MALLLCMLAPAQAEEARKLIHDDIEMLLTRSGDNGLEIAYGADVPAQLRELGVNPGTVLVRGQWDDRILIGEAYTFAPGCGSIAYPIRGVVDYGGALVVIGPMPMSCQASERSWDRAVIRFEPPPVAEPERERRTKRIEKPKAKAKAKAKAAPKPRAAPRAPSQPSYQWPTYQWRW